MARSWCKTLRSTLPAKIWWPCTCALAHCRVERGCTPLSACRPWTSENDLQGWIRNVHRSMRTAEGWGVLRRDIWKHHTKTELPPPWNVPCWHAESVTSWGFLQTRRRPSVRNSWNRDSSDQATKNYVSVIGKVIVALVSPDLPESCVFQMLLFLG